jgi:hypothetical protein
MPSHVVVDGSNLATEGRSMPSLAQLSDAVTAFMAEHPDSLITVVVDATFGHRIDAKEVSEFDEAIANNELVAPPAGAIGRGDAFLLGVAHKVGATVLSNDSFQEFHGTYTWLFDEGRLIGGKPVPHIGWVFVARVPVRGPISRTAVKDAKRKQAGLPTRSAGGRGSRGDKRAGTSSGSPLANQPMPVPSAPPPNARTRGAAAAASAPDPAPAHVRASAPTPAPAAKVQAINDLLPFLSFVEHHPVGTSVNATVESYSSHGAYVRLADDVAGYVPLRLMAEPAPRSAREVMKIGDSVTLIVDSFAATRRSIDLAVPGMSTAVPPAPARASGAKGRKAAAEVASPSTDAPARTGRRRGAAAPVAEPVVAVPVPAETPVAEPAPASSRRRRSPAVAAAAPVESVVAAPPAKAGRSAKRSAAAPPAEPPTPPPTPAPTATPTRRSRSAKAPAAAAAAPVAPTPAKSARSSKKAAPAPTPVAPPPAAPAAARARRGRPSTAQTAAPSAPVAPAAPSATRPAKRAAAVPPAPAESASRPRRAARPAAGPAAEPTPAPAPAKAPRARKAPAVAAPAEVTPVAEPAAPARRRRRAD